VSRVWFAEALGTAAAFWRVMRRDGVTLGFTTHDRDLWFDGVLHRAAPGMTPSAIRRSADLDADSAEVEGALSHDAISAADLAAGRFDGAELRAGLVDWESGERDYLYRGAIGGVTQEDGRFTAELASAKAALLADPIPRTTRPAAPGSAGRAATCRRRPSRTRRCSAAAIRWPTPSRSPPRRCRQALSAAPCAGSTGHMPGWQ